MHALPNLTVQVKKGLLSLAAMLVTGVDLAQVRVRLADYPFVRISAQTFFYVLPITHVSTEFHSIILYMILYKIINILHKRIQKF